MITRGIRILDHDEDGFVSVKLEDILELTKNLQSIKWTILFIWATGDLGQGKTMLALEEKINKSEKGLIIEMNELMELSKKLHQIIDILVIGCENEKILHRYKKDQEMYETCDIVIQMIDSSYWEVFSKDDALINRLSGKFQEIELLQSDFQNEWKHSKGQ